MHELEHQYGHALKPEELAQFLNVDVLTVMRDPGWWGGLEVAPGKIRFFQKKIEERLDAQKITNANSTPTICFYPVDNSIGIDYWMIGEVGKTQIFKKLKGFQFIHFLLLHQEERVDSVTLYNCGASSPKIDESRGFADSGIGNNGFHLKGKTYHPELDLQARKAYQIRIERLKAACEYSNPEKKVQDMEEIVELEAALKRGGKDIRTNNLNNARSTITKRIKEALERIHKNKRTAYIKRYLNKETVERRGKKNIYKPDPNDKPNWILFENELSS